MFGKMSFSIYFILAFVAGKFLFSNLLGYFAYNDFLNFSSFDEYFRLLIAKAEDEKMEN